MHHLKAFLAAAVLAAIGLRSDFSDRGEQPQPSASEGLREASITPRMAGLPLRFEANAGQWDSRIRFMARGSTPAVLTDDGMTVGAVSIKLVGAQGSAARGEDLLETKSNFFLGNDPNKWRTNVANYSQVRAKWLPGVDVVWHDGDGGLEYDLEVAAGVDARALRLEVEGAESLVADDAGDLEITTPKGTLVQRAPHVVQEGHELAVRYRLEGAHRVALELTDYDTQQPVLVDPVLVYSTYLGTVGSDNARALAVDSAGNAYLAVNSSNLGNSDVLITKLAAGGATVDYATNLGGSGNDLAYGIAVDGNHNVYVTGDTASTDFPTTTGATQTARPSSQASFVAKLDAGGSLLSYSTYLGGTAVNHSLTIGLDGAGKAIVGGYTNSTDFPTTTNAFQTTYGGGGSDAFLTKLDVTGTAFEYSTFLGGSSVDGEEILAVAVDATGNAYVSGLAASTNFPTTTGAFDTSYNLGDGFVAKLDTTKSGSASLVYSTFFGPAAGQGVAVDSTGNAYVTGRTASATFPTTVGAFQTTLNGSNSYDAFVTKLNASGSALVYSTLLGGSGSNGDYGYAIAVDASGNALLAGYTFSTDFPVVNAFQSTHGASTEADAFIAKLDATGSTLVYSSYLGGTGGDFGYGAAVDGSGNAYFGGYTTSTTFPTTPGAYSNVEQGPSDAFVLEVSALENGTTCSKDDTCGSGHCVDGICCSTACAGQCEACDVSTHVGTCTPVAGTPHGSRPSCAGAGACAGTCDGVVTTACAYPNTATSCGSTCSAGTESDKTCNGQGDCINGATHSCDNLACTQDGTQCKSSCATDVDCLKGFICKDGKCVSPTGPSNDGGTVPGGNSGGCNCNAAGTSTREWSAWILAVSLGALVRWRRHASTTSGRSRRESGRAGGAAAG